MAFSFSKKTPSLIHFVAPPLQIEPAPLGFDLGFDIMGRGLKSYHFTLTISGGHNRFEVMTTRFFMLTLIKKQN